MVMTHGAAGIHRSARPLHRRHPTGGMWQRCGDGWAFSGNRGDSCRVRSTMPAKGVAMTQQRILVVEDDARIADLIAKNLEAAGFECQQAADGGRALAEFARLKPALVVLDLGLAGMDGLEVTRRIRKDSDVPILMVTARSSEGDKLLGPELGADDYVTKPFSTAELIARVRALLRRSSGTLTDRVLELGALRIDPARRSLEREGESVPLTTLEFD